MKGFCCPCFVYGKTQARLRDPSLKDYERFNSDCLIFAGASYCGISWMYVLSLKFHRPTNSSIALDTNKILYIFQNASTNPSPHSFPFFRRTDIRTQYEIRGNVLGDFGSAFCCMACTLIQNEKEVIYRQSLPPADKTGYQAVADMNAAPHQ